jgi:hypothetical protein
MPGQNWQLNESGAFFSNDKLSKDLIAKAQPMTRFRQFTTKRADFGKNEGQKLLFDKLLDVETSGGQLSEGQPIPKTGFKIRQGTCTAYPYGNSIPWTEEFATYSEFDVTDPIQSRLINDAAKVLDAAAEAAFRQTKIVYTPLTTANPGADACWSYTGVPVSGARRAMTPDDFVAITDAMKSGVYGAAASGTATPVPPYDEKGNYVCLSSVSALRELRSPQTATVGPPSNSGLDFRTDLHYGNPEVLFSGEEFTAEGTRYVSENHILKRLQDDGVTTRTHGGECYIFGKDPVMEIVATPMEVRRNVPGDYGRDRGLAWYYVGGFAPYWTFDATNEPENRIVRVAG